MRTGIYALIPARGGSKGILRKNLALLGGKPLIEYSISLSKQCGLIERIFVSTDSEEIRHTALRLGAEAPFLRPLELSDDNTPDLPVFQHWLEFLKDSGTRIPEIIVHLRPTSPLRTLATMRGAIELLQNNPSAHSVRTVCEPGQNPFKMWRVNDGGFLEPILECALSEAHSQPRQALPKVFWQTASVDVIRTEAILTMNSMVGSRILPFVAGAEESLDIDDSIDLKLAELLLAR